MLVFIKALGLVILDIATRQMSFGTNYKQFAESIEKYSSLSFPHGEAAEYMNNPLKQVEVKGLALRGKVYNKAQAID
jgi:hypothetical protein